MKALLIANRGEVAVRVARAASALGIRSVGVHGDDDRASRHLAFMHEVRALRGTGTAPYLDAAQLVAAAVSAGCDAIHPGYGFLSETPAFVQACLDADLTWVGPPPPVLATFGDKAAARALATSLGVPVLEGTSGGASLEDAAALLAGLGPGAAIVLKAVAGGGGRGMRVVRSAEELPAAFERCRSEATMAFGDDRIYAEHHLAGARHLEVQLAGDGQTVVALGQRECSLQRRHQKLVEIAPPPGLSSDVAGAITEAAIAIGTAVRLTNLMTVETLVAGDHVAFIEANARLQVEHTVTEEVTGIDLVQTQLLLAAGATLADVGIDVAPAGAHAAIQLRVNAETLDRAGQLRGSSGTITRWEMPTGPGVRIDTATGMGDAVGGGFDPLLAKVIVRASSFAAASAVARGALDELVVEGVATNAALLRAILDHPDAADGRWHTTWVEDHLAELVPDGPDAPSVAVTGDVVEVRAPMQGTVVAIDVAGGDVVRAGAQVAVLEAMKMEHVLTAATGGVIDAVLVGVGDTVTDGQLLMRLVAGGAADSDAAPAVAVDLDAIRPDLAESLERHDVGLDACREDAVAKRRTIGRRTARENVEALCDPGTFVEYGPLVIAAERRRRPVQELIERTPADGLIAGVGAVNGQQCVVLAYDYMVLAGTQGTQNHRKKDRMFELAERWRLPVVFFTEGGGGRPGDTDGTGVAGLDVMAFHLYARLSGLVPLVAVNAGYCFAGNAAILGCSDVVIATEGSSIGMGGPAMIEGGGLGVVAPGAVGPMEVQVANGVVDVAVADEAEAIRAARQYLGFFQGPTETWACADQRLLRHVIPENRLRVYDVRTVIETMADTGSVLELRRGFGAGMVTALARVEGMPIGIVANNPTHLAGAIDSPGADKAARFLQVCDAFGVPVVFLCDTPGIMVGPDAEKTALVRHANRLFVTGANLAVPTCTIVLRKAYGLGAQAMAAGSFKAPTFVVSWPTGEFGGMGLEGAVRLGYRNELAAIEDPAERQRTFEEMVARMYEHGKALNTASHFEIDDVIDPATTRRWISAALSATAGDGAPPGRRADKRRPNIDTW